MFLRAYLSGFAASVVVAGSILGVSPDKQELYKPNADGFWHCLLDPSIVLLFDQINDDFCDCPDGSDEPAQMPVNTLRNIHNCFIARTKDLNQITSKITSSMMESVTMNCAAMVQTNTAADNVQMFALK